MKKARTLHITDIHIYMDAFPQIVELTLRLGMTFANAINFRLSLANLNI